MTALQKRGEIFKDFLEENNYYIDYNGINYTIVDKEQKIINIANTSDEIYNFIIGFITAKKITDEILENVIEQNNQNIEHYEAIIKEYTTVED